MKTSIDTDLTVASEALEHLTQLYDANKMTLTESVDVAARLGAVAKLIEKLDKNIKADIASDLSDKTGTVKGDMFKADRTWVPAERLDSKALKEGNPKIHEKYLVDGSYYKVTFGPR